MIVQVQDAAHGARPLFERLTQSQPTGTQEWFAATAAELTDCLQQRITQHDTAKLIEACQTCATA